MCSKADSYYTTRDYGRSKYIYFKSLSLLPVLVVLVPESDRWLHTRVLCP